MTAKPDGEMSLIGHLTELRTRIIICLLVIVGCTLLAFVFADEMLGLLTKPVSGVKREPGRDKEITFVIGVDGIVRVADPEIRPDFETLSKQRIRFIWEADEQRGLPQEDFYFGDDPTRQLYYHSPIDPILMQLKVALMLGLLAALPIVLWHVWKFVTPGLTVKERKVVQPMLSGALILFPIGALFAYYLIQLLLRIMQQYEVKNIEALLDIYKYLSLMTTMMVVFGCIFELPLVIAIAARIGLVTPAMLKQYRRHAYVGLAFASMVLTPMDPYTMIAALVPMICLYELSVYLAAPMALLHARDHLADETEDDET